MPNRITQWVVGSLAFALCFGAAMAPQADAADPMDWTHWRGPMMSGASLEKNLPEKWDAKGEGILWRKEEYATRSTPVIMNGKMYVVCRAFPESTQEGEKTVCLDATTAI